MQTSASIILVVNLFKVRTRIRAYLFIISLREIFLGEKQKRFFLLSFSSLFCFSPSLLVVGGSRCRQITASLSSLHVRTLLSRIAPCLCITSNEATNASGLPDT